MRILFSEGDRINFIEDDITAIVTEIISDKTWVIEAKGLKFNGEKKFFGPRDNVKIRGISWVMVEKFDPFCYTTKKWEELENYS